KSQLSVALCCGCSVEKNNISAFTCKFSLQPLSVGENRRLCQTVGGKETENKLLLQISEAEQVSDFERILNTHASLWERTGHVWRRSVAARSPTATPLPRSAYSLRALSRAYHHLFLQHEESLQPLVDRYRQETKTRSTRCPSHNSLDEHWYENLHSLSEYYEEDHTLREQLETVSNRIIDEEVKANTAGGKNFNVNLTNLIGLHVNGEGVSSGRDPELEKNTEEWLSPSMTSNVDDRDTSDCTVERLAENLDAVQLGYDAKLPTITFSNCCERPANSESTGNTDVVIHLTVPPEGTVHEARPPM
ncbi:uncharacterized protein, partial [Battus philenor]|uniref:uncharacterized protein n=1 Tax=Battus philenor TaxID=42288 RepID=UPI0035D08918